MHRQRITEIECMCSTHTNRQPLIQTNTMGTEMALSSVVVDGFFKIKSGAVCQMRLMVSNYKDTERVKTKQNNDRKGVQGIRSCERFDE